MAIGIARVILLRHKSTWKNSNQEKLTRKRVNCKTGYVRKRIASAKFSAHIACVVRIYHIFVNPIIIVVP